MVNWVNYKTLENSAEHALHLISMFDIYDRRELVSY